MTEGKTVNGVAVDKLDQTLGAIRENPGLSKFVFRAHGKWVEGAHCQAAIKDFYGAGKEDDSRSRAFVLHCDEPPVLLGTNTAPNPTEAALYALSGCVTTTFVTYAASQGVPIDELELELEGDVDVRGFLGLSHEVRNGYREIRVNMRVKSDAPDSKIQELCKLAQRRSPIFDIVTHETPVNVTCERISRQP